LHIGEYGISWDDRIRVGDETEGVKFCSKCTVQVSSVHTGVFVYL